MVQNTQTQQNDYIASFLAKTVNFCKARKKAVLTAAAVLVIAAAVGGSYASYQTKLAENSWAAYYNAQAAYMTQGPEKGFFLLDAVSDKFPGTEAAQYARLLKGDLLYAQENYAQAAEAYKPLVHSSNPSVMTAASLSLAAAQQAVKDYAASVQTVETFIASNPKSFALPQAYFTLALSQELAGQKDKAEETYKRVQDEYAQTYFGAFAKDKLNQLKK